MYSIRHDTINFVRELWNTRGFFPEAPIIHPVFTINLKENTTLSEHLQNRLWCYDIMINRDKIDTPNAHVYDCSLFWFCTCTEIYAIVVWGNTSNTLDIYIFYFQELSWFICHSCFFFKNHSESWCCLAWNHCCRWVYIIFRNVETMKLSANTLLVVRISQTITLMLLWFYTFVCFTFRFRFVVESYLCYYTVSIWLKFNIYFRL